MTNYICLFLCFVLCLPVWTAVDAANRVIVDGEQRSAGWLARTIVTDDESEIHFSVREGDRVSDVVGGMEHPASGTAKAKGNAYRIDTAVTLDTAEFYLDFSDTQTLQYYVYESTVEFGTYNQIFTFSESVSGIGANWYSSGPIGIDLQAGMHYIVAVSWSGTTAYYYNSGDSQATSFGAHVHGYAVGIHPLPASFSSTSNDQAIYYQRITTNTGSATPTPVPTPTPPSSPTATPTIPSCIHDGDVTLDGEITAGDAQLAFLIALGSYIPVFEEACAADCNGDSSVTAGDAQQIFLTALGGASCEDPITMARRSNPPGRYC
ncbi:dockerin type I repeat-containing protein [bacterium]|nr:dockerin type I repeat-containing protein [candidate division CSSED10-310 bacterium]